MLCCMNKVYETGPETSSNNIVTLSLLSIFDDRVFAANISVPELNIGTERKCLMYETE